MTVRQLSSSQHPAVQAWNQLCPNTFEPNFVEVLQEVRKGNSQSCVYRLDGVGHRGASVIAKRCTARCAHVERSIYEEILPHLPVSSLTFYGCVDQPETEYSWLFLEDAGGEELAYPIEGHRRLAARWLGQMHASAARIPAVFLLPDRGPQHYLDHLRFARSLIESNIGHATLNNQEIKVLEAIMSQCYLLESKWGPIVELCDRFPKTLVHCDFAKYNLRVRISTRGINLVAFDWEMAGQGVPAPDIAEASGRGVPRQRVGSDSPDSELVEYWSVVRESWPALDLAAIKQLADLGAVFRLLAAISWESESIRRGYWPIRELRWYEVALAVALDYLGFAET
jgi:Ser/Thr protein kinase RdoA (MazF antagonist)